MGALVVVVGDVRLAAGHEKLLLAAVVEDAHLELLVGVVHEDGIVRDGPLIVVEELAREYPLVGLEAPVVVVAPGVMRKLAFVVDVEVAVVVVAVAAAVWSALEGNPRVSRDVAAGASQPQPLRAMTSPLPRNSRDSGSSSSGLSATDGSYQRRSRQRVSSSAGRSARRSG